MSDQDSCDAIKPEENEDEEGGSDDNVQNLEKGEHDGEHKDEPQKETKESDSSRNLNVNQTEAEGETENEEDKEIKTDKDDDKEEKEEESIEAEISMTVNTTSDLNEDIKSPAKNPPSNIIYVQNLVRPFTLLRLKELLGKTGKLMDNQFWIDRIKSKCYVAYETTEAAVASRDALHGIRWPEGSSKELVVDFSTQEELDSLLKKDKESTVIKLKRTFSESNQVESLNSLKDKKDDTLDHLKLKSASKSNKSEEHIDSKTDQKNGNNLTEKVDEVSISAESKDSKEAEQKKERVRKGSIDVTDNAKKDDQQAEDPEASKENIREKSPAKNPPSSILFIRNLVRPFTLMRLKELLEKTGKLVEDQFWIDKIKSKCYACYEKTEDAIATREALHGTRWPDANPKKLVIDFATKEELEYHLNLDKEPPVSSSAAAAPSRTRTHSKQGETVSDQTDNNKKEIINEKFDAVIRRGKPDKSDANDKKDHRDDKLTERGEKIDREKRPIREWDKEKFVHDDQRDDPSPVKKRRVTGASPEAKIKKGRDKTKEKDRKLKDSEEGNDILSNMDKNSAEHESPAKQLDDLYKKTKATPCIYWLPLDEEQAKRRAELRADNLKKREEELAARETSRATRLEEQRTRRRTPPYERRERSPIQYNRRENTFNRRGSGRGSYSGRRNQPTRFRGRSRSRSSASRSRSPSYSRSRSKSSSRSRSRSATRKRSRSRTPRSPRRNGANYVRRSRSRSNRRSVSRSRSPPPKRMVSPRRR